MSKVPRLDYYIKLCIEQSFEKEGKKNDSRMWYRVFNDNLLFAIKSRHPKVVSRILYRLHWNIPRKFNLKLCIVMPDYPGNELWKGRDYDLYSKVDPNYSVATWRIDSKLYTIRALGGIHELLGEDHLKNLKAHGYDYMTDNKKWDLFVQAFTEAYGMTPLEANTQYRKKLKEEKEALE